MKEILPNSGMYFTSLKIKNVKCFGEEQTLNLLNEDGTVARWTLILGENGVGKTTLLKCLAWMTPVIFPEKKEDIESRRIAKEMHKRKFNINDISDITGVSISEIEKPPEDAIRFKPLVDEFDDEAYEKIFRKGDNMETSIEATLTNGSDLDEVPLKTLNISIDFKKVNGKLEVVTPHASEKTKVNPTNIFAYSASRHLAFKNLEKEELAIPTYNLLSDFGDLYDAEQVLAYLDYTSIKEQLTNEKIEDISQQKWTATNLLITLKKLLCDLLPDIKNPESIIINPAFDLSGEKNSKLVEIQTSFGRIPLFDVSLGYQTMLSWAVDLAIRMLWLNPESKDPLKELAIVIVDEIDLHLHPVWQRTLKRFLTNHFERTQFICTAHSPFMAQSAETENLCVIKKNEIGVEIKNNPQNPSDVKGWKIGQIATSELFGVSIDKSDDIEIEIDERRNLLDKDILDDEDILKMTRLDNELSQILVSVSEEDQLLLEQIRIAAELLKDKKISNDKN